MTIDTLTESPAAKPVAASAPQSAPQSAPLRRAAASGPEIVPAELPEAPTVGMGGWGVARALSRLVAFLLWTALLSPVQVLALRLRAFGIAPGLALSVPVLFHRGLLRILGITVEIRGAAPAPAPVLIVSNHVSWLDIVILSTVRPLSFVSKAEVADWPFFGWLSRLQRTLYVERERRHKAGEHRDGIAARLAEGDALVLFPEGTSGDGNRLRPFKTALFSAAETKVARPDGTLRPVLVQPWTIAFTGLNGMPMGQDMRPFFAWYGDMELAPHLWQMVQLGPFTVKVELHPPVTLDDFANRKVLAAHCQHDVAKGLSRALAGREEPPAYVLGRPQG